MKQEKWFVYVIKCDVGKVYIGLSSNPDKRLSAHNNGISKWTRRYKNWKRIYLKRFECYYDARRWEMYLKKQKGGQGLTKILRGS